MVDGSSLSGTAKKFLVLQGASFIGSSAYAFAVPWLLLESDIPTSTVGLLLAVQLLASGASGILLSGQMNRFSPKNLMIVADLGQSMLTLLVMYLFQRGASGLSFVFPMALVGMFSLAGKAARESMAGMLVPDDAEQALFRYASLSQGARDLAHGFGPLLAGLLLTQGMGLAVFAFDAISFLASAAFVSDLDLDSWISAPGVSEESSRRHGTGDVVRFINSIPQIRLIVVQSIFTNMLFGPILGLLIVAISQSIGFSASTLGVIMACYGLGGISGAAVASRSRFHIGHFRYYGYWLAIATCGVVVMAVRTDPITWGVAAFIIGVVNLFLNATGDALFTTKSSAHMRVALFAVLAATFMLLQPAGYAVAGFMSTQLGDLTTLRIYALAMCCVAIVTWISVRSVSSASPTSAGTANQNQIEER